MDDNGPLCENAKSMTQFFSGMLFCTDNIMQRISAVGAALYYSRACYRPQ